METHQVATGTVVKLIERIDSLSSREVEAALMALVDGGVRNLIGDLTETKYVSSAGLRVFLIVAKSLKRAGGQMVLVCGRTGYVFEVLETAGFTQLIPVFDSVAEAAGTLS